MLIQLQTGDLRATALRAPVALDVMELKGRDVRSNALEERRKWIGELLSRRRRRAHLRQACSMGLEGIVSKRTGSG
jgi:ATP-dependent DNA ligase